MSPQYSSLYYLPGLAYEAVVRARNRMYSTGFLQSRRLPHPVISIGNLTLGGSGKTPLVIYLAKLVRSMNFTPVLLSRGYGRLDKLNSHVIPPGSELTLSGDTIGDEPALIRRRVPDIWLGIAADRYEAALEIVGRPTRPVFILDDGFQHRRLHRDLDLVVIDRTQPFSANRVFPRGTLREPLCGLRRCHAVIFNGLAPQQEEDRLAGFVRGLHPEAPQFHCIQRIERIMSFSSWRNPDRGEDHRLPLRSAFLVAALGNSRRFFSDMLSLNVRIAGTHFFRDHARLEGRHWSECVREARSVGADAIVTTEKDAIKIVTPPDYPLFVAVQSTRLVHLPEFEVILKRTLERDA